MAKFKIREMQDGFSVWELRNVGGGYAWEDVKRRFKTPEGARWYIETMKGGKKDDECGRKSE